MKRTRMFVLSLAALLALTLAGCGARQAQAGYLGPDAAKAIALNAAGLSEKEASFTKVELENRNGTDYYEVDFTAAGQEYEYDIDALTGTVIQSEGGSRTTDDAQTGTSAPTGGSMDEAAAKAAALRHAGLQENQVTFLRCHLDRDDGRQVYDVEFYTKDGKEYDYEIDAATGEVLSSDYDAESGLPSDQSTTISADRAKEIALAEVPGATVQNIHEFEVDRDDGRLEYEGSIHYNGVEYEFSIDGYSGAIRSWETDH
ncbi:MAG: PepSY domain-containing protein [Clostridiales bacterium]|nr:PepSY domain-containing protein [Clostridiales bacterium]